MDKSTFYPQDAQTYQRDRWSASLLSSLFKEQVIKPIEIKSYSLRYAPSLLGEDSQRINREFSLGVRVFNTPACPHKMERLDNILREGDWILVMAWYHEDSSIIEAVAYDVSLRDAQIDHDYENAEELSFRLNLRSSGNCRVLNPHDSEWKAHFPEHPEHVEESEDDLLDKAIEKLEHPYRFANDQSKTEGIRSKAPFVVSRPGGALCRTYWIPDSPFAINAIKPPPEHLTKNPTLNDQLMYTAYGSIVHRGVKVSSFSIRAEGGFFHVALAGSANNDTLPMSGTFNTLGHLCLTWNRDPGEHSALIDVHYAHE